MNRLVGCLVLAVVMVTAAWAGAGTSTAASASDTEEAETWSIPAISPGERVVYERAWGDERLTIQVTNTTIMTRDGFGRPVEALLIEQNWHLEGHEPRDHRYAVDPNSGTLVWWENHGFSDFPPDEPPWESHARVYEWRSLPFLWGGSILTDRNLTPGEQFNRPAWARVTPFNVTYAVGEPTPRGNMTVLPVNTSWDVPKHTTNWVTPKAVAYWNQTLEFGEEHGFPVRVVWGWGGGRWWLVEHEPGEAAEQAWRTDEDPAEPPWKRHPDLPFLEANPRGPPPENDHTGYWPISLKEAHEFAWQFAPGLREFRLEHDDEIVLVNAVNVSGSWGYRLQEGPVQTEFADVFQWYLVYQAEGEKDQWWVFVELKRWTLFGVDVPEHKTIRSEGDSTGYAFLASRLPAGVEVMDFAVFADRVWQEHATTSHAAWFVHQFGPIGPLIPLETDLAYQHIYDPDKCYGIACVYFPVEVDARTGMVTRAVGSAAFMASFEDRWVGPGWQDWLGDEADREIEQPPSIASSASASASGIPRLEIGSVGERCGPSVLGPSQPGSVARVSVGCFR